MVAALLPRGRRNRAGLRARLEAAIEAAIAALDALDGDPDFEPDADHEDGHDREEEAPPFCPWPDEGDQSVAGFCPRIWNA